LVERSGGGHGVWIVDVLEAISEDNQAGLKGRGGNVQRRCADAHGAAVSVDVDDARHAASFAAESSIGQVFKLKHGCRVEPGGQKEADLGESKRSTRLLTLLGDSYYYILQSAKRNSLRFRSGRD
jgi:hypothetical protein